MPLHIPARFNLTAHFLDRPAALYPNRTAILGEPAEVTYAELAQLANRVGDGLRAEGIEPGDRIVIALPDSAEFIAAFFGVTKIGAVAVPVNSMARAADYAYYLKDSGGRFAIVHRTVLHEFLPAIEGASLKRIIIVGSPEQAPRTPNTSTWAAWLRGASEKLAAHPTAASDTAFFLYTSGSGGQPKGAVHQHKDMLVTSTSYAHGVLGLREDDRTFSVSKLFFAYGLGNGMYFPFSVGASTLLHPERPRPDKILELVARYRPTVFFSVPTFYAALLREAERGAAADLSCVRLAVSAGEMLPAEIFEQFRNRFGLEIVDGIGSTEMLQMFISSRPGAARAGSCGVEVPNYEAKVVDERGATVPAGQIGNLWVKGESAFAEYWNKPELTAWTKQGEWVVTGDKFTRDADGYYHYCGRADDMMKVAGMWVSPGEVENALLGHPAVAEAAVVAAIDADGLTRPLAHVVLRDGAVAQADLAHEIHEFVRQRLPAYKCPHLIRFQDQLPKTATGKIQRFRLREAGAAGRSE